MSEMSKVPNLFITLDLDPDKPWSQADFDSRIKLKRQEWSRLANLPTQKGQDATWKRSKIPELEKVASDETLRAAHARAARELQKTEKSEKRSQLDEKLELWQLRGFLLEDELNLLLKEFAGTFSEKEIRARIKVPIQKAQTAEQARKPALEPSLATSIRTKLQSLGHEDLYAFLDLPPAIPRQNLRRKAQAIYDDVQKKPKTPENTTTSELSGYCLNIFNSDSEQEKYNETLRMQTFQGLLAKIDTIAQATKKVGAEQMEQVMREAKRKRLNLAEAETIIMEHARKRGYSITISEPANQAIAALQLCGYCRETNDSKAKHCRQCGQPLKEPCPNCGQQVSSLDAACAACGFRVGNRAWVKVLLNEVEAAFRGKEYAEAATTLRQAQDEWRAPDADALVQQMKAWATQIQAAQAKLAEATRGLEAAIQEKEFYRAKRVLSSVESLFPSGSGKAREYQNQITAALEQARKGLALAHEAARTNPDEAILLYQKVLQGCRDCQEAREMLAKTPPRPPTALRARAGEAVVSLTWNASPSPGVQYAVVRKARAQPVSVNDGEKLGVVSGTRYDDAAATVGVPLFYMVFADREGVASHDGAALASPVLRLQEVANLTKQIDAGQVRLVWEPPPNVHEVLVARSGEGYPRTPQEGTLVPTLGVDQMVDRSVQNNRRYFYTVFARFKDHDGQLRSTPGVQIEAIPEQPPAPIEEVSLTAQSSEQQVQLRWAPPAKGDVIILRSERSMGLQVGTVILQQNLSKYGTTLPTTDNQLQDRVERIGIYYYVPVVLFQGVGYVGKEHRFVSVDDVSDLSAQNLGHILRLHWKWPPNCQEVLVASSTHGWPKPHQPDATTVALTRAQYDLKGHYDIAIRHKADYYITVFSVISQDGQRIVAAGERASARATVRLASRITLDYEIKKARFSKKLTLKIVAKGEGTLPALVLTRKQSTLPHNRFDGEIILQVESAPFHGETLTFDLPAHGMQRQSYGRLFLEDDELYDAVTIRHPGLENLRLF